MCQIHLEYIVSNMKGICILEECLPSASSWVRSVLSLVNKHQFEPHSNRLIVAQVSIGGECWSSANGVASGGCTSGTQCGPWLPDGGSWDGTSPWYCLASPKLTSGATCDYATKVVDLKINWKSM